MDRKEETCTLVGAFCRQQSERAIKVESRRYQGWVPQSVVHDDSEVWKVGQFGKLVLKGWWAEKQGLELD